MKRWRERAVDAHGEGLAGRATVRYNQDIMKRAIVSRPGRKIHLKDIKTDDEFGLGSKEEAQERLKADLEHLGKLQHMLYADDRFALLIVFQAMDTGGKDGTIRNVMAGFDPVGCVVTSFKVPTDDELDHDFLWRIHRAVPPRGVIGVFNRSHYEDVLVTRVHKLVSREVWELRYRQINDFERTLTENGVPILKFFLHISKAEQARRLEARLADKSKNWKFSPADVEERKLWKDYQVAFEDAINACTTKWAPWHIVPADKKWVRDCIVARAMLEKLESLALRYPKPLSKQALSKIVIR
jgi:PPK2 family polyphosphate:nucleotide phosphotransferase